MPAETSVSIFASVTGVGALSFGWAIALVSLLLGKLRRSQSLFGWGMIAVGLMVLATPLTVYLYYAVRDGAVAATPFDLLLLSILAFLGGAVASLGAAYLRTPKARAAPAPGA